MICMFEYFSFFVIAYFPPKRFEKRIYIPLPEKGARSFLLKHQLKSTPNKVSDMEIDLLAEQTNGWAVVYTKGSLIVFTFFRYSGADIGILVRDAVFEPVRRLQVAKYFKKTKINNLIKYEPVDDSMKGAPDVEPKTMM